ncbi:uncharacterized protein GGS22DRAFT_156609 [Annulohypoxylon maeteangense]|uniref:uncharacterized protein n=1 Tax=Annulohypoxylon maeteangense TaxID=1927788 RepID=UPI002007259B|nr:uncharacterized protein GGS22DRAFT_156609 [Annulohypoxylon maeteangense]KAI0887277.1 hypothetical protein GGS22DRAFT_156609 [Annulohypoxylon maeteangense]
MYLPVYLPAYIITPACLAVPAQRPGYLAVAASARTNELNPTQLISFEGFDNRHLRQISTFETCILGLPSVHHSSFDDEGKELNVHQRQ